MMDQLLVTLGELKEEVEKWMVKNKNHPTITLGRTEKFFQSHCPDIVLQEMLINLKQMNLSYENKIKVRNFVGDFLNQVEDFQRSLKIKEHSCKIDKHGYINITTSNNALTFYVFEYQPSENNFKLLRFFQRSHLGECDVCAYQWDRDYYKLFSDGVPTNADDKLMFYDKPQIFTSEEILDKIRQNHQ